MPRTFCYVYSRRHLLPPDRFALDGTIPPQLADGLNSFGLHTTTSSSTDSAAELAIAGAEYRTLITKSLAALELYFSVEHAGVLICDARATPTDILVHVLHHPLLFPFSDPLERPICFLAIPPPPRC